MFAFNRCMIRSATRFDTNVTANNRTPIKNRIR